MSEDTLSKDGGIGFGDGAGLLSPAFSLDTTRKPEAKKAEYPGAWSECIMMLELSRSYAGQVAHLLYTTALYGRS